MNLYLGGAGGDHLADLFNDWKLFDWGRGPIPIGWTIFIVGILLLSNSMGLILSQPYVFEGVPKEYTSYASGTLDLPYIPSREESVEYIGPDSVQATDPFNVEFRFPEGRVPTIPYRVQVVGENGSFSTDLFQMMNGEGIFSLGTRISGIKDVGTYHLILRPDIVNDPQFDTELMIGYWNISIVQSDRPHPIPILYDQLAFGSSLSSYSPNDQLLFDIVGIEGLNITDYRVDIGDGSSCFLKVVGSGRWGLVDPEIIGNGWTSFELVCDIGDGNDTSWQYLTSDPDHHLINSSWIEGKIERIFTGEDELFNQIEEGPIELLDGDDLELYPGEFYRISIELVGENGGPTGLSADVGGSRFYLPVSIRIGSGNYHLSLVSEKDLEGTFRTPTSVDGDLELMVQVGGFGIGNEHLRLDIDLRQDHLPGISFEPDIFDLTTYGRGKPDNVDVIVTAEWENFNRKDFKGPPVVQFNGSQIKPMDEEETLFEHSFTYQMEEGSAFNGGSIEVSNVNSLEFANWLALILPIPSIFVVFPVPITGVFALVWFALVSLACLLSVGLLFYRTSKPLWRSGRGASPIERMKRFLSPDSDLAMTSKTYLGALFFFFAIFWMLLLFDQPTPVPGILSDETPIWIRMFLLADASVWEEISGRVVLIGLPLFVYHSLRDGKGAQWKQFVGGTGTFGNAEILLILLSGTLFGVAHIGWGPWKVLPTFVHGLLFGYLFVKVGLHASIAMHFLFDYTGFINEITGFYGPTWIMVFLTTIALGGLFMGDWVQRCHEWASRKWLRRAPRPVVMLGVHSLISIMIGITLFLTGGVMPMAYLFLSMPLMDILGYFLWKSVKDDIGPVATVIRGMVYLWAMGSLFAGPFAFAWVVKPEVPDPSQE